MLSAVRGFWFIKNFVDAGKLSLTENASQKINPNCNLFASQKEISFAIRLHSTAALSRELKTSEALRLN